MVGGPQSAGTSRNFEVQQGVGHASEGRAQAAVAGGGVPRGPRRQGKDRGILVMVEEKDGGVAAEEKGVEERNTILVAFVPRRARHTTDAPEKAILFLLNFL